MRLLPALLVATACSGGGVGDIGSATQTFAGPFGLIAADVEAGRIEVVAGDTDEVTVEFLPNGSDVWSADEGDDLVLVASCLGEDEPGCGGGFILTVPAGQAVDLYSERGDINFGAGLEGDLVAQTASSSINGANLGAAGVTALTGTGPIGASFADTPRSVNLDSGSSPIAVSVPGGAYALDVDTNGDVDQQGVTDDPSGPVLRVHSGTGNITIVGE